LGQFPQLFCLQRRHLGHPNFGTWGLTNSIPPVSVHETLGAIQHVYCVRKLSPSSNVKLVGGQEVFGQYADGITSQPPWVGHGGDDSRDSIWVTQHTDDMGKSTAALLTRHSLDMAFPVHRSHGVRLSAIAFVSAYAMALEAAAYALVRRQAHASSAAPARGLLLAQ
jgi:hypothetical protein